jgi:signal peptidase II
MKNNKKIALLLMICVIILIIVADLLTKFFTVGIDREVIPGFFKFFYTQNTGAAWSIFAGNQIGLIIISVIAIAFIVFYTIFSKSKSKFMYISLGFILGGALGNMVDRIAFGYVRDFIKLEFINFPIFNVADMALTVGVILICIYFIISGVKEIKKNGK